MITQAPLVPDLNVLKDLPQPLAFTVLGVILVGMLLFYTNGFGLRARFTPKPPEPAPPAPAHALPEIVDTAEQVRREYMDNLLRQVNACDEDRDELKAELKVLRESAEREIRMLREENERLRSQIWRRGTG